MAENELPMNLRDDNVSEETKTLISSLHTDKDSQGKLCKYQGCWYYYNTLQAVINFQTNFQPQDTDIILSPNLEVNSCTDKDQVFGNSIESSEENTELKILDNGKETECEFYGSISEERDNEKARNMSGHHSYEFKIGPKNEDIKKNRDSLEDPPPVFYMDKNVMACELPEIIVVSNYKELTYNVVKDICVDEGVPMMQEKFLSNEKDSVKLNSSKLNQENLIVIGQEVKDDSEVYHKVGCDENSPMKDVVATSRCVSKEALTLGDIISMEVSQRPPNNNNINGPDKNVDHESEQEKTENRPLNDVLEDFYHEHNLFSSNFPNGFGERSFSDADSGLVHITYSGPITVSGNLSVRSDGSTVSADSFANLAIGMEQQSSENGGS